MLLAVDGIDVNAKDNKGYGWFGYVLPFCYQVGDMRHAIFGYGCLGLFLEFFVTPVGEMGHAIHSATCNMQHLLPAVFLFSIELRHATCDDIWHVIRSM